MAILDSSFSSASSDIVAVFDANQNQVLTGSTPMKAVVKETIKIFEHPVEQGETVADDFIIENVEIELSLLLQGDYRSAYQEIRQLARAGTILTIQTKTGTYPNMAFIAFPHDESPDSMDAMPVAAKLREVQFVIPQSGPLPPSKVKDKNKADTVERGTQLPAAAPAPNDDSLLYRMFG